VKRDFDWLSQEYLRRRFSYDPLEGVLRWRNGRSAGRVAGTIKPDGYVYVGISNTVLVAHRIIWRFVTGKWPANDIDHINRVKSDNVFSNLRESDRSENQINSPPRGAVKFRGVSKSGDRWVARISRDGQRIYLGHFSTPEKAAAAYLAKANEVYGSFAGSI